MEQSKVFSGLMRYLKAGCVTLVVMSLVGMALVNVAPFFTLEQMMFEDWYGKPTLPPEAVRPFQLGFLLFCWLSVVSGGMLYYVVRYGLEQRERWSYHCYLLLGVAWPIGAVGVAVYTTAYWYLLSASIMTVLFLPPVFLVRPYIKPA